MTLFTEKEKENLAYMLWSKDKESRNLGWEIIDATYETLTDEKEKESFKII